MGIIVSKPLALLIYKSTSPCPEWSPFVGVCRVPVLQEFMLTISLHLIVCCNVFLLATDLQMALLSLTFTLIGEPTMSSRTINISVSDGIHTSSSLLNVGLLPRNNHPPVVRSTLSEFTYVEDSMTQAIGQPAGFTVSDNDSSTFFPLVSARIWLTSARDQGEMLSFGGIHPGLSIGEFSKSKPMDFFTC